MAHREGIRLSAVVDALTQLELPFPPPPELEVQDVTADSRLVADGALFVAVPGGTHDGHEYLEGAVASGAVAAIGVRSQAELLASGIRLPQAFPYIQVTDARRALAEASAALYGFPSREFIVVGVTGTDGKTTTCALLESILTVATRTQEDELGRVGVITTIGARIKGEEQDTGFHVTTPGAPDVQRYLAQMRDAGCEYAIVESTSHGLAQHRVAAVAYDVAAVTNITHEHLDYHGSREAYVAAKALLFRSLYDTDGGSQRERFAVLNGDDEGSISALKAVLNQEAAAHGKAVSTYVYTMAAGKSSDPASSFDVSARDIVYTPAKTRFTIDWWNGPFAVETSLIGHFNVQNVLCACTVALGLGIAAESIIAGVAELQGVSGRMERIDRGQSFLALVDFAHSPASLERALETLRPLVSATDQDVTGRLIAIFGCAGLRDRQKRRLMGRISGRLADFTVITAEDPRTEDLDSINREIEAGVLEFTSADSYCIVPDRAEAIAYAVGIAQPGDVVVAFGKGHERSMCFGTTEYPWSDQLAMIEALNSLTSPDVSV